MKIHIRKIRPEGNIYEESFPVETFGLMENDTLRFISPVAVKAEVTRAGDEVLAKVDVCSRYASFCSRCLEEVEKDWTETISLVFDIEDGEEFVEMDDDIRQEIILNLPVRILCEQDCRGLCVDCGMNLNKQECAHKHAVISDSGT